MPFARAAAAELIRRSSSRMIDAVVVWRFKSNLWLLIHRPLVFAWIYWWPLAIMFAGGLLDGITTWRILRRFGAGPELHPAMWLVARILGVRFGVPLAMLAKMGFAVFTAAIWRGWCRWILVLFGVLGALGAIHNHCAPF